MSGIELSFSIQGRWGDNFPHMEVHLLDCFDKLLAGEEEVVREAFLEQMEERFGRGKHLSVEKKGREEKERREKDT